jgi:hypothetical protein
MKEVDIEGFVKNMNDKLTLFLIQNVDVEKVRQVYYQIIDEKEAQGYSTWAKLAVAYMIVAKNDGSYLRFSDLNRIIKKDRSAFNLYTNISNHGCIKIAPKLSRIEYMSKIIEKTIFILYTKELINEHEYKEAIEYARTMLSSIETDKVNTTLLSSETNIIIAKCLYNIFLKVTPKRFTQKYFAFAFNTSDVAMRSNDLFKQEKIKPELPL